MPGMRQGPPNMETIPLIWIEQILRQRLGGKRKGKKCPFGECMDQHTEGWRPK